MAKQVAAGEFREVFASGSHHQIGITLGKECRDLALKMEKRFKAYMNAPGGISNGITAGYTDEEDIYYNLHIAVTGKDDDWRWTEQWLPHASWFLYAAALGSD